MSDERRALMGQSRARVQGGTPTTDLILSAQVAGNADVFPLVLKLHVPVGSVVADVTYGKGVFWRNVPAKDYDVRASDLKDGIDCRALALPDASVDALVLDPPYMEGLFRRTTSQLGGDGTHGAFRQNYSNGLATTTGPKLPRRGA